MKSTFERIQAEFPLEVCPEEVEAVLRGLIAERPEGESRPILSVALSGGADSLFAVLWIMAWFPRVTDRLELLHFNHGTRPEENEREAVLVQDWARGQNLPLRIGQSESIDGASEAVLREKRFAFFARAMAESGSRVLALGHQADDVAENFLLRLARGSGPEGLAAPRPVSSHGGGWSHERIRPLLEIPAARIREFLSSEGIAFVEDSSNREDVYLRNRIRAQVLPAWKASLDRDLLTGTALSRRLLDETSDFLEQSARVLSPEGWRVDEIPARRLKGCHPAPVRFLIQRWLAAHGIEGVSAWSHAVVSAAINGEPGRWSAAADCWVVLDESSLRLESPDRGVEWEPIRWSSGVVVYFPDGSVLRREGLAADSDLFEEVTRGRVAGPHRVFLQLPEGPEAVLAVRRWRQGDRFMPLGAPGSRKLQDWFTDRKIKASERHKTPIITAGDRIIWVPGFPPSHVDRLSSPEEKLLGLTYEPA